MLDPEEYMVIKHKQSENPFLDQQPSPRQAMVDMKGCFHALTLTLTELLMFY